MTNTGDLDSVQRALARISDLPAMPEVVAQVLRLTEDQNAGMQEVRTAIEQDPSLTAKILRISNSPYYGMRRTVGTLQLALVILGIREVRNIVLGVSVFDTFNDSSVSGKHIAALKAHSVLVAGMCRKLTSSLGLAFQGEDFIAGLLHDIGKLLMVTTFGERYMSFVENEESLGQCQEETARFGFNHPDAAAALISKWNLPETLHDAILLHHDFGPKPLAEAKDPMLAAVVRLADAVMHWGSETPEGSALEYSLTEAWDVLAAAPTPIPPDQQKELLAEFATELTQLPPLDV